MPGIIQTLIGSLVEAGIDSIVMSAAWTNITLTHPTVSGTTNDPTASFVDSSPRTISVSDAGNGVDHTLTYRINSGAYNIYSTPFSLAAGDTLGFRISGASSDFAYSVVVTDDTAGEEIDSFSISKSGSP